MTEVRFDEDEFYPFIYIRERPMRCSTSLVAPWCGQSYDLSDVAIAYINETNYKFRRLQDELQDLTSHKNITNEQFEEFVRRELGYLCLKERVDNV